MEIRRFFVPNEAAYDNYITIDGEQFTHMVKVLRYKVGYQLILCLDDGLDYHCTIREITKKYARAGIDYVEKNNAVPYTKITLYQALPKGDKLDLIIQKCTELGIFAIKPFTSRYTNETKYNLERNKKIALEACKQCGRGKLPIIGELTDFDTMLEDAKKNDILIMPYENATVGRISSIKGLKQAKTIGIIIGSEGGFEESEVKKAKKEAKAKVVSLGNRILRCETAAIVTNTLVMYELGELSK